MRQTILVVTAKRKKVLKVIKDSGSRREFETGAVRDIQEGKGRCDLMPLDVIYRVYSSSYGDDSLVAVNFESLYKFTEGGDVAHLIDVIKYNSCYGYLPTTFLEVSKHFEEGAKKYGEHNWQKGIPAHCYINSAVRHYLKFLRGDNDEPHDRAFIWNVICCIWTCIHKPELNDYAKKEGTADEG